MAGNFIVTMMLLMFLLLVVGKAENIASLSFNDPPITTQEASTSPHPINTQAPSPPLPINTQQAFPSPFPIDTPIAFPAPLPIDIPLIPTLPIPGLGFPKNRQCASMCSKRCYLQRRNRFAYVKCYGLCNLKCIRGISDVVFDCTKNCAESKSPNFNTDAGNVYFMNSCYEDCKKN